MVFVLRLKYNLLNKGDNFNVISVIINTLNRTKICKFRETQSALSRNILEHSIVCYNPYRGQLSREMGFISRTDTFCET